MSDTIKLPGLGPTKTVYVVAGVGLIGGIVVYAYWKRSQASADVAAVPAVVDAGGAGGYVEDSTAAGYNTVAPSAYSYSPYGYDLYGNPLPPPTGAGSNGAYTTNADWAVAAEGGMQSDSLPLSTIQTALGRVLGGLSVSSAQRDIFMSAIGIYGQPPQGYPTPIKLTDSGAGPIPAGTVLSAPTGLKVTGTTTTHVTLAWNAVKGAQYYRLYRNGVSVNVGSSQDTKADVGGLAHNTTYHFHVVAVAPDGTLGAKSADVTGRTKK